MDLLASILAKGIAVPAYQVETGEIVTPVLAGPCVFKGELPGGAQVIAEFTQEPDYGVIRRRDRLINLDSRAIEVSLPAPVFTILGGSMCVHAQTSEWSRESQNIRIALENGPVSIGSKGRSCSGYAPYFRVESPDFGTIDFHVHPCGDWRATFRLLESRLTVTLDRFGAAERVRLGPGESLDFSLDCLVCVCPSRCLLCLEPVPGEVSDELASPKLSRRGPECAVQIHAVERQLKRKRDFLPVVYNTWFDRFHKISVEGMEAQLEAAAEVGCEVFVVDAGWYGTGADWWASAGDWRENPRVFSEVGLAEFADRVRARGLDFGIWMEPERVSENAPVRREHPEWFVAADLQGFFYPDLTNPQAADWVRSEITRVVESCGVKWLKLDCNFDFSADPHGAGHRLRMLAWYEILDDIARKYPDLVLEGCASGGKRNDLLTASHFHTFFLSDTVDPVDVIRIGMSSFARLAPRMQGKWAVIYPTGNQFTPYGNDPLDTGDLVLCPQVATGSLVSSHHLDFVMRAAMTGVMGISGNIAGLSSALKRKLGEHIEFYKKHRELIQNSVGITLTPVEPLEKRDGVAAIQLSDVGFSRGMVFVYNIKSSETGLVVKPLGLDPSKTFTVCGADGPPVSPPMTGVDLSRTGIHIACPTGHSEVILIEPRG